MNNDWEQTGATKEDLIWCGYSSQAMKFHD